MTQSDVNVVLRGCSYPNLMQKLYQTLIIFMDYAWLYHVKPFRIIQLKEDGMYEVTLTLSLKENKSDNDLVWTSQSWPLEETARMEAEDALDHFDHDVEKEIMSDIYTFQNQLQMYQAFFVWKEHQPVKKIVNFKKTLS